MSGSNRSILAALAGLAALFVVFGLGLMLGASNVPEQQFPPYRYATDKPQEIDSALTRQVNTKPLAYRTPCDDPKGQTESELCAQWRAANAAEDSAFWAKLGFWIGAIGSGLLLCQIALTRQALNDTRDATRAMIHQNEIAKDAMRPWLRLKPPRTASIRKLIINGIECWAAVTVDIELKNFGQSPAILPQADALLFNFSGSFNRLEAQKALFDEMDSRGFGMGSIYPGDSENLGKNVIYTSEGKNLFGCKPHEMIMMIGARYLQPGRNEIFHVTSCFSIDAGSYDEGALSENSVTVTLRHINSMTETT